MNKHLRKFIELGLIQIKENPSTQWEWHKMSGSRLDAGRAVRQQPPWLSVTAKAPIYSKKKIVLSYWDLIYRDQEREIFDEELLRFFANQKYSVFIFTQDRQLKKIENLDDVTLHLQNILLLSPEDAEKELSNQGINKEEYLVVGAEVRKKLLLGLKDFTEYNKRGYWPERINADTITLPSNLEILSVKNLFSILSDKAIQKIKYIYNYETNNEGRTSSYTVEFVWPNQMKVAELGGFLQKLRNISERDVLDPMILQNVTELNIQMERSLDYKLTKLDFSNCHQLRKLHLSCPDLKVLTGINQLTELSLDNTNVPLKFSENNNLKSLSVSFDQNYSKKTSEILRIENIPNLVHLQNLSLTHINFPGIEQLPTLKELNIESNHINFAELSKLRTNINFIQLDSRYFDKESGSKISLANITNTINEIKISNENVTEDIIVGKNLKKLHIVSCSSLKKLDLADAYDLEELEIFACYALNEILLPTKAKGLNLKIQSVALTKLNFLQKDCIVKLLSLKNCGDLNQLSIPSSCRALVLDRCRQLTILEFAKPHNIETLEISNCPNIELSAIPFNELTKLTSFSTDKSNFSIKWF